MAELASRDSGQLIDLHIPDKPCHHTIALHPRIESAEPLSGLIDMTFPTHHHDAPPPAPDEPNLRPIEPASR